jgi:hypothetical protein
MSLCLSIRSSWSQASAFFDKNTMEHDLLYLAPSCVHSGAERHSWIIGLAMHCHLNLGCQHSRIHHSVSTRLVLPEFCRVPSAAAGERARGRADPARAVPAAAVRRAH